MPTAAIIPIKRFGHAKSRLAGTSASGLRPALAEAMLTDVLSELSNCERLERVFVVSGEPAAATIARDLGADHVHDPSDVGHSEATLLGIANAEAGGATVVALLPGDCPLVRAIEVDGALADFGGGVGVIPDRHGSGTNGLLLSPLDAISPAFGPGSRDRHMELARAAGVNAEVVEIPSLALDLDTGEDLRELAAVLSASPGIAPATAAALALLDDPLA